MKNKLLRHLKRGFGAVEVILLLTVVAIIATFAFITVDQIKKKPITYTETNTVYVKDNADYLTVNDINTQLKDKKYSTVHETVKYLETKGYAIGKLKPQDRTYEFVYLQTENLFGILQNRKIIYPEACKTDEITPNIWRFASSNPYSTSEQYSYYLLDSCEGSVATGGGLDVGDNEDITNVFHSNSAFKGTVVLRTNSLVTSMDIYSYNGEIRHYGISGEVSIERASFIGYFEYGKVTFLKIKNGKITAKNGGFIDLVYVLRANVAVIQDGGFIDEAYCVSTDEDEAKTNGYNNVNQTRGGNVFIEYINPYTLENYTDEQIKEFGNSKIENSIANLSFEGVLAVSETGERQLFTLENFSSKANSGYSFAGYIVELLADIDLKNISNWKPINNFEGTFDGRDHIIRNLSINSDEVSASLGLFGKVGEDALICNLHLKGFNISSSGTNSNVGGLIGQAENSTFVENVDIDESSTLIGGNVGGIIGVCSYSSQTGKISILNCNVSAKLAGNMVGGFVSRISNLEYGNYTQSSITLVQNSAFQGQIFASNGKNNWGAGLIAYASGGDYHSKIIVDNVDVLNNGNIKSCSNNFTSAIFGSSIRYHLNNFRVNDQDVSTPVDLDGIQVSKYLLISINKQLYSVCFSYKEELNRNPKTLSENKAILASSDMKSLGINGEFHENEENYGKFDEDVWYEIINANVTEDEDIEFIPGEQFQYIGVNPEIMFADIEGQLQRKVYVAGYDNLNECDIYKFDFYRFVEVETPEEDNWVNKLELGSGEYYDDPTPFVDNELYDVSFFYLEDREASNIEIDRNNIVFPPDDSGEWHGHEGEDQSVEPENPIEKTKIYVVTKKIEFAN